MCISLWCHNPFSQKLSPIQKSTNQFLLIGCWVITAFLISLHRCYCPQVDYWPFPLWGSATHINVFIRTCTMPAFKVYQSRRVKTLGCLPMYSCELSGVNEIHQWLFIKGLHWAHSRKQKIWVCEGCWHMLTGQRTVDWPLLIAYLNESVSYNNLVQVLNVTYLCTSLDWQSVIHVWEIVHTLYK